MVEKDRNCVKPVLWMKMTPSVALRVGATLFGTFCSARHLRQKLTKIQKQRKKPETLTCSSNEKTKMTRGVHDPKNLRIMSLRMILATFATLTTS